MKQFTKEELKFNEEFVLDTIIIISKYFSKFELEFHIDEYIEMKKRISDLLQYYNDLSVNMEIPFDAHPMFTLEKFMDKFFVKDETNDVYTKDDLVESTKCIVNSFIFQLSMIELSLSTIIKIEMSKDVPDLKSKWKKITYLFNFKRGKDDNKD